MQLRKTVTAYFRSAWLPGAVAGGCLIITVAVLLVAMRWSSFSLLANFAELLFGLSVFGVLASGITQLIRRQWRGGIINLILFPVLSFITSASIFVIYASFGPSEDNFGKDIIIPTDMVLENPLPETCATNAPAHDVLGDQLRAAFSVSNQTAATVPTDLNCLNRFRGPDRNLLLRHLASSARWRLTEERGKLYAYRRFPLDGMWRCSLNGYYGVYDFDHWSNIHYQFRILLGIDGPVMAEPWRKNLTSARVGTAPVVFRAIEDKKHNQGIESYFVLESTGAALEVFEQSQQFGRPFTSLAVTQVQNELDAVLASARAREHGFDEALLPPESIQRGAPEIHLVGQGGIYQVYARVNPGAAGRVYLKVFEATRNTRLSADRITERSREYTGWSADPQEQFFFNTEITVYEGDWDVYYPARFELWFVPQDGGAEHKLVEKIFKIEGWQR